jgi:hypothetical protein
MTILLLLSYIFATDCKITNINDTKVDVYYQRVQEEGVVSQVTYSEPIILGGEVSPEYDIRKDNRPNDRLEKSAMVSVPGEAIGKLSFVTEHLEGRLSSAPTIAFDNATMLATVNLVFKAESYPYDSQQVYIRGRVMNEYQVEVNQPISLPFEHGFAAKLNPNSGQLEPLEQGKNRLSSLLANGLNNIKIRDYTGCIWYEGKATATGSIETLDTYISFEGRSYRVYPEIIDNYLKIFVD